jgi:transcriptional regulator with XRE-family HTH domain
VNGDRAAIRMRDRALARFRDDLERLIADAGITHAALAKEAGISAGHLADVLGGKAEPSLGLGAKLAVPLGADLAFRLYANTGPTIHDRHQARIFEALLGILGGNWRAYPEATVWKPVRGAIDAVLHDRRATAAVATEIESDIRRIEQAIRWSKEKAEALPSWSGWTGVLDRAGEEPQVSQLLIVRRTRANERIAREFGRQLAAAYPAHPADALAALAGERSWPGSALVWARIERDGVRFLPTR